MRRLAGLTLLCALAFSPGCDDDDPAPRPRPAPPTPDAAAPDASPPAALTFSGNIAPIFNAKCVKCHQAGGIAPFALDSYEPARAKATAIAAATRAGIMPPFLVSHDGSCGEFEDAETLTADERAKIWDWAMGDRLPGAPVSLPKPAREGLGVAEVNEWKTPNIAPMAQGGEQARHDEYRCFALEPGLDRDRFITAYEVLPGTPALVHHLIAFIVEPDKRGRDGRTNAEVMDALDKSDPDRPGWPCFGMAGEGVVDDGVPAVWAPGQGPVTYPGGIGVKQTKTAKVVVQLHYNLADPGSPGQTDSTTVRFRYADTVARQAVVIADDAFLDSAFGDQPMTLEPGRASVKRTWRRKLSDVGFGDAPFVDLYGVMPHMHERGVRKEVRILSPGAPMACVAHVERWDFHWQKMYFYKTPIRLGPTSEYELECEWNTSQDRAPVTPGWGTRNEMCTAIFMLVLP